MTADFFSSIIFFCAAACAIDSADVFEATTGVARRLRPFTGVASLDSTPSATASRREESSKVSTAVDGSAMRTGELMVALDVAGVVL